MTGTFNKLSIAYESYWSTVKNTMEEVGKNNVENSTHEVSQQINCSVKEEPFRDKMFLDMDQGEVIVDPGLRFDLFSDQNSVPNVRSSEYVRTSFLPECSNVPDWNNFDNYYANTINGTQFFQPLPSAPPPLPPPPPPPSTIILENQNVEREQYQFYQQPGEFFLLIFQL